MPVYVSYIGGGSADKGVAIAVESTGNVVVVGTTGSTNFPLQNAYQPTRAGSDDAFVARLDSTGSILLQSTYLGGSGIERTTDVGLWVDSGSTPWAYVVGETESTNFPTSSNALDTVCGPCSTGGREGFLVKVNLTSSSAWAYSTYFGGNTSGAGIFGVAIDNSGIAYITGQALGSDLPLKNAFQTTNSNPALFDSFVAKLNPAVSGAAGLIYSSYLGGNSYDCEKAGDTREWSIAVDATGAAYVAGYTYSSDLITATDPPVSANRTFGGGSDAYVIKISATPNGSGNYTRVAGSYLGGSNDDGARTVVLRTDSNGLNPAPIVAGETSSTTFVPPLTALTPRGNIDGFVARLNTAGTGFVEQHVLGGTGNESVGLMAVSNPLGYFAVVGGTASTNLVPQQYAGARSTSIGGTTDGFIALYGTSATFVPSAQVNTASAKDANCICNTPHPVNTRTGNFWTMATDLVLEGMGPTITWQRTYSAQARSTQGSANMPLGAGWFHR